MQHANWTNLCDLFLKFSEKSCTTKYIELVAPEIPEIVVSSKLTSNLKSFLILVHMIRTYGNHAYVTSCTIEWSPYIFGVRDP